MKTILTVILCLVAFFTKSQDFGPKPLLHKFGLGIQPLSGKIGARGSIKWFMTSIDFASDYNRILGANLYYLDVKTYVVIHKRPAHRFYTGGGMEFFEKYYGKEDYDLDGYFSLVPLGIEIFPSDRAPNLAIVVEGRCFAFVKWSANFGIFYYLK